MKINVGSTDKIDMILKFIYIAPPILVIPFSCHTQYCSLYCRKYPNVIYCLENEEKV